MTKSLKRERIINAILQHVRSDISGGRVRFACEECSRIPTYQHRRTKRLYCDAHLPRHYTDMSVTTIGDPELVHLFEELDAVETDLKQVKAQSQRKTLWDHINDQGAKAKGR